MGEVSPTGSVNELFTEIHQLLSESRSYVAENINSIQLLTYFEIGRRIVEHEQKGLPRALYGQAILKDLSLKLTESLGKGFSQSNLSYMRKFYLEYHGRAEKIFQTSLESSLPSLLQPKLAKIFSANFPLRWSQYIFLLSIHDLNERKFYEIESLNQNWSLTDLKRQYDTSLYERIALSRNPERVKELAESGHQISQFSDLIKDPYVLEFLNLEEKEYYSENNLETAIINKLEKFLLELGRGFLFESRQKRFTFDADNFYVDLVFYNRLLRCYVLVDLKIGKLTHQDLGQMQMYVNYFDRYIKQDSEQPTVGIILCKMKNEALVDITLPKDSNIQAATYQLYLPNKDELRQKLIQWTQDVPETD